MAQFYEDFSSYEEDDEILFDAINGDVAAVCVEDVQYRSGKGAGITASGSWLFAHPGVGAGLTQIEFLFCADRPSSSGRLFQVTPISAEGEARSLGMGFSSISLGEARLRRRPDSGSQTQITKVENVVGASRYLTRARFTWVEDSKWHCQLKVWPAPGAWDDDYLDDEPLTWDIDYTWTATDEIYEPGGAPAFTWVYGDGTRFAAADTRLIWYGIGTQGSPAPAHPVSEEEDPPTDPPTGVVATVVSSSRIDLQWTRPAGATGSKVRLDGGTTVDVTSATSHSFTGLSASTLYTMEVWGYNSEGDGPAASAFETTPSDLVEPLHFAWQGAVTHESFTVLAEPAASCDLDFVVATDDQFANVIHSDSASGVADTPVKFVVTGLDARTTYHWKVSTDDDTVTGRCRTFPVGASNLHIALASCAGNQSDSYVSNTDVFATIADLDIDLFLHMGDMHYRDRVTAQDFRDVNLQSNQSLLYRTRPLAYVWDDHDWSNANSVNTYSAYVPHYPLLGSGSGTPIMQDFQLGRLRVVLLDARSQVAPGTMIGATQKARLMAILDELASTPSHALLLCVGVPWIDSSTSGDSWGSRATERAEIANAIEAKGLTGRTVIVAGDMHGLGIDSGVNNSYADGWPPGPPVFQAASIDCRPSTKGGPYSEGTSAGDRRFGEIIISDDGGETIDVDLLGVFMNGALRTTPVTLSFEMEVEAVELTEVVSDLPLTWAVHAQVAADLPLTWAVHTTVAKDLPLSWPVHQEVHADLLLTWAVESPTPGDLTEVVSDLPLAWAVHAPVHADLPLTWQVQAHPPVRVLSAPPLGRRISRWTR